MMANDTQDSRDTRIWKEKSRISEFIEAASKMIAKNGYDRTSVREIAQTINVTSGAMFYHFRTKSDLLEAIIAKGIDEGLQHMRASIDTVPQCALHWLRALVSAHMAIIQGEAGHYHRVWIREWDKLSDEARQRLQPSIMQYRNLLDTLLAALAREGHLRSDPETFRHLLLPALNWTPSWAKFPDEPTRTRLAEQICAAALNMPLTKFQTLIGREIADITTDRDVSAL